MTTQVLRVSIGGFSFHLARRSVETLPAVGTVCLVDDGTEAWMVNQRPAKWTANGWWTPAGAKLSTEPTHWSEMDSGNV